MATPVLPPVNDRQLGIGTRSPILPEIMAPYGPARAWPLSHGPTSSQLSIAPFSLLKSGQQLSSESSCASMTPTFCPSLFLHLPYHKVACSGKHLRFRHASVFPSAVASGLTYPTSARDFGSQFPVPNRLHIHNRDLILRGCVRTCDMSAGPAAGRCCFVCATAAERVVSQAGLPCHHHCCEPCSARGVTRPAPGHRVDTQGPLRSGLECMVWALPVRSFLQPPRLGNSWRNSNAVPGVHGRPEESALVAVTETEADEESSGGGHANSITTTTPLLASVEMRYWLWKGYRIRYQSAGTQGPAIVLIHGFGGNCDHFRKNLPELGKQHRVFAIDLLGYGYSDKPDPKGQPPNTIYTFERWGEQVADFCNEVVGGPAFLVGNSVGCITGLQVAVMAPQVVRGLVLLNISLRLLHVKKQKWFAKPFIKAFQTLLRTTALGSLFFGQVAKPDVVKKILQQAYHDDETVTDELVDKILSPGLQLGAVDVFLDFVSYSGGPLPEELLPQVKCPVLIAWGDKDPWEPIDLGRTLGQMDTVEEFVILENVGHCPQDEAPQLVNPVVKDFVAKHAC